MKKDEILKLIKDFGQHSGVEYDAEAKEKAKEILIEEGKSHLEIFFELLNSEEQGLVMDVSEILGEIKDDGAIPYLKKILYKKNIWGGTYLQASIALIKLGDKDGEKALIRVVKDAASHRDLRIRSAETLIKLGAKNLFYPNEKIDYNSDSMNNASSELLKNLVEKLKRK